MKTEKILGIYVGWRGASLLQTGTNELIDVAVSLPTFPGRKRQADQHADQIRPFLITLEERLINDKNKNQLILIGHSLGGNMLLRATTPLLIERLMESKQGELARGFGSLIILLNPASELTEWGKTTARIEVIFRYREPRTRIPTLRKTNAKNQSIQSTQMQKNARPRVLLGSIHQTKPP
jgi:hypothetical protein